MIKAVIFDMDGVLIDSETLWWEAEIKVYREVGLPMTEEKLTETMGSRVDEAVEYWFSRYPWQGASKNEVEARIFQGVIELIKERGEPREGAKEIVGLFASEHIPMAIASSSPTRVINTALEKLSLGEHIRVVHSAEKEPYGKPHPGVFITTAKSLGVAPEVCLVFEDSPNGVLAAKAAKMKCVAVPHSTMRDDKRFCIADMVIGSLKDFRMEDLARF